MIVMNLKKSGETSDKDYIEFDSNDDIDKKIHLIYILIKLDDMLKN